MGLFLIVPGQILFPIKDGDGHPLSVDVQKGSWLAGQRGQRVDNVHVTPIQSECELFACPISMQM